MLHRTEADFHRSVFLPSQAHHAATMGLEFLLESGFYKYSAPLALILGPFFVA
jgi:hypothetical protein